MSKNFSIQKKIYYYIDLGLKMATLMMQFKIISILLTNHKTGYQLVQHSIITTVFWLTLR